LAGSAAAALAGEGAPAAALPVEAAIDDVLVTNAGAAAEPALAVIEVSPLPAPTAAELDDALIVLSRPLCSRTCAHASTRHRLLLIAEVKNACKACCKRNLGLKAAEISTRFRTDYARVIRRRLKFAILHANMADSSSVRDKLVDVPFPTLLTSAALSSSSPAHKVNAASASLQSPYRPVGAPSSSGVYGAMPVSSPAGTNRAILRPSSNTLVNTANPAGSAAGSAALYHASLPPKMTGFGNDASAVADFEKGSPPHTPRSHWAKYRAMVVNDRDSRKLAVYIFLLACYMSLQLLQGVWSANLGKGSITVQASMDAP